MEPKKNTPAKSKQPTTLNPAPTPEKAKKDAPDVAMFPPTMLLLMVIAGITLSWLFPMKFFTNLGSIGFVLTALGLGVIAWCKKLFEDAGTNISPNDPTETIVTGGPFKYSRNPIYIGFLVVFTGLALMMDSLAMLLLLPVLYVLLDKKIIPPEELYLEEKFGMEYLDYKGATPRWISLNLKAWSK